MRGIVQKRNLKMKVLFLLILFLLSGCTMEILDTGETLESGQTSSGIGMRMLPLDSSGMDDNENIEFTDVLCRTHMAFRRGFGKNSDFGVRFFYVGLAADVRYQVLRNPLSLSFGLGGGTFAFSPIWAEGTVYLSKKYKFITPYVACRYVISKIPDTSEMFPYYFSALGCSFSLCERCDLLCEIDFLLPGSNFFSEFNISPLGSFKFNFHDKHDKEDNKKEIFIPEEALPTDEEMRELHPDWYK